MRRTLSVAYFEMCEGEEEAPIVKRCNADGASLEPTAATLAELMRAVGYIAPVAPDASVQAMEDALVNGWLAHEPVRVGSPWEDRGWVLCLYTGKFKLHGELAFRMSTGTRTLVGRVPCLTVDQPSSASCDR